MCGLSARSCSRPPRHVTSAAAPTLSSWRRTRRAGKASQTTRTPATGTSSARCSWRYDILSRDSTCRQCFAKPHSVKRTVQSFSVAKIYIAPNTHETRLRRFSTDFVLPRGTSMLRRRSQRARGAHGARAPCKACRGLSRCRRPASGSLTTRGGCPLYSEHTRGYKEIHVVI